MARLPHERNCATFKGFLYKQISTYRNSEGILTLDRLIRYISYGAALTSLHRRSYFTYNSELQLLYIIY
jgi:hypothetical protein